MTTYRVGVQLHPQHVSYEDYAEGVRRADEIGVDTIWNWDHFYPLSGDPNGWHFEGWTLLTAMAMLSQRSEVGTLVTCNSYRNPNLLADMARTVDHISGGRLILGIGAGWFERDYESYGYPFGTATTRLEALGENLPVIIERWKKLNPPPTRKIPILIGGGGEKITLRLVAQYATMWNGFGPPKKYHHKNQVLDDWCARVGRDPGEIERTVTVDPEDVPNNLNAFIEAGATHMIVSMDPPWDYEVLQRLVTWRDNKNKTG